MPPRAARSARFRAGGGSRCASSRSNKLAVIGVGILVFFVLFCFVGPLIYHTNQLDTNRSLANLAAGAGAPAGYRQPRGSTSWPAS